MKRVRSLAFDILRSLMIWSQRRLPDRGSHASGHGQTGQHRMKAGDILAYLRPRKTIIGKFVVVSGSAVGLYFVLLYLMIEHLGFDTPLLENVANALSMELSVIYNFLLSRAVTWKDRLREKGGRLFVQVLKFHAAIGVTIVFRLGLFPALQYLGVPYMINAAIGVALAAVFDFAVYDNLVFRRGN